MAVAVFYTLVKTSKVFVIYRITYTIAYTLMWIGKDIRYFELENADRHQTQQC